MRRKRANVFDRTRDHLDRGRQGPKIGDVCVGCVHKPNPDGATYFMIATEAGEPNLHVVHPQTKAHIMAKWMLLCDTCTIEFGDDISGAVEKQKIPLTNIKVWREEDGEVTFTLS